MTLPPGRHLYLVVFNCMDSLLDDLRKKLLSIAVSHFETTEFNWNPRPLPAHTNNQNFRPLALLGWSLSLYFDSPYNAVVCVETHKSR